MNTFPQSSPLIPVQHEYRALPQHATPPARNALALMVRAQLRRQRRLRRDRQFLNAPLDHKRCLYFKRLRLKLATCLPATLLAQVKRPVQLLHAALAAVSKLRTARGVQVARPHGVPSWALPAAYRSTASVKRKSLASVSLLVPHDH